MSIPASAAPRRQATTSAPPAQPIPQASLLVVDDDREYAESFIALLRRQNFAVTAVDSLAAARTQLKEHRFDAVLVDLKLPDGDGIDLVREISGISDTEVIVITGHASIASAVDALKDGALDYLTKPIDPAKLKSTLANLVRTRALKREVMHLRAELLSRGRFGPIIGRSPAMQPIFEQITRVSPTDASVLIEGESGSGKEVVAQAIHQMSRRRDAPLVPVNCGAIPETLIESELFGHERGSFTGAEKTHRGFFERAGGGTLFLDEITEMPPQLQVKLLRVLETGKIQRIGGAEQIPTDVRVLAATNRDPREAIRDGKLREDLYFRLAVFPIRLPPLRERRGDISLLAEHFLALLNDAHSTSKTWAGGALDELEKRDWKGNVRELKNAVYRSYILADELLQAESAVMVSPDGAPSPGTVLTVRVGSSIADAERALVFATLEQCNGDKRVAAQILGISLKTLYNRLNVYKAAATS